MSWDLYADRRRSGRKFDNNRLSRGLSERKHAGAFAERNQLQGNQLQGEGQLSFDFNFSAVSNKAKTLSNAAEVSKSRHSVDSVLPYSAWPIGELSEIRARTDNNIFHLILPLLSKLNQENRWITLISPPADIDTKLFAYHGIDVSRVLLIHPKGTVDDTVTMNKALKNGTSGIVILWTENLPMRFVAQWRKSVKQGNCRGIIVNHDVAEHYSPSIALALDVQSSDKAITIISTQRFGQKINYRAKRSFPVINLDTYSSYTHFSLLN